MTMRRRDLWLLVGLLALIAIGGVAAWRVWQGQERIETARAAASPLPDLRRWPPPLQADLERASAGVRSGPEPVAALRDLAVLYQVNGFSREAARALAALRKLEPQNPRWPYLQADLDLRTADKPAAAAHLATALALEPGYVAAWLRLGDVQESLGHLVEARTALQRARTLAPGDLRAEYALVALEARHGGNPADMDKQLSTLLSAHANVRQLHELRADVRAALGDKVGAGHERRLAEECELYLDTSDPWLDELLVHCYDSTRLIVRAAELGREGRFAEDEALLKRAVTLAPYAEANPFLWEFLSNLYLKMNRPAEAQAALEKAVAGFPDEPRMAELLAQLLRTMHAPDEAAGVMRQALTKWPQRGSLQAILGYALRDAGRPADAVTELREALRLDPTLTEARYNLGCALLDLGQRAEAHDALAKALATRPDFPEALFAYGAMVLESGNATAAEPSIRQLNELRPEDANARYLMASLDRLKGRDAEQAGDFNEAARQYEAGLAVVAGYPALLREAGTLAMRREQPIVAAGYYERYVKTTPDDPRGYLALGWALQQARRTAEAEAVLANGLTVAQKVGDPGAAADLHRLLGR